jgi:hypothetical protein
MGSGHGCCDGGERQSGGLLPSSIVVAANGASTGYRGCCEPATTTVLPWAPADASSSVGRCCKRLAVVLPIVGGSAARDGSAASSGGTRCFQRRPSEAAVTDRWSYGRWRSVVLSPEVGGATSVVCPCCYGEDGGAAWNFLAGCVCSSTELIDDRSASSHGLHSYKCCAFLLLGAAGGAARDFLAGGRNRMVQEVRRRATSVVQRSSSPAAVIARRRPESSASRVEARNYEC